MSFSSLPTELLQQIIESSVPSYYHSQTYNDRQTTLSSLTLVSSRFRQIAQPILRQIVSFHWLAGVRSKMKLRIEEVKQWNTVVRQAVVELYNHDDMLKLMVSNCSQVQKLTVNYHSPKDDFRLLSQLSELRDLHIFSEGESLPRFQPFAALRSFTLGWSGRIRPNLQDLLSRSNFPALQALALSHFDDRDLLRILRAPATLQLVGSLDAFCIGLDYRDLVFNLLKNVLSSTLITGQVGQAVVWASTLSQPVHLCLRDTPEEEEFDADEVNYVKLAGIIETSTVPPLLSLYLDDSLRPPFGNTSSMEAGGLRRLVEACEKRKVEVVYEAGPSNWTKDPIISQEFWRRQRQLRREGEKDGQK